MMAQRSILRADQLDRNDTFNFAKVVIDGYSGGDLQDGYLMGLVLQDGYLGGNETIRMDAHDGAINQAGTGQVTFSGNVLAKQTVIIDGDLTVQGTTTTIDTEQMIVTDPITVINASGSEASSDWTGLSARDTDGYNRTGWVFSGGAEDGYWGLSTDFSPDAQADAVPDRAIAYVGEGDAYGDLSSTLVNDSGASKIGVDDSGSVVGDDVQEALENIYNGTADLTGTPHESWTINNDATTADEDVCLIFRGGDGTSLMEGYLCMITDSVGGTRFEFKMYDDAAQYDRVVHVGPDADTSDVDACVVLNAGDGSAANSAELCMDGTADRLDITASTIRLDGDIELGTGSEDCITFNGVVCSDIIPCCDDAYDFGSSTKRWNDGYFTNVDAVTGNIVTVNATTVNATDVNTTNVTATGIVTTEDLTVNGDTILGSDGYDCVTFNADICSDLIPCCDDAYQIGTPGQTWHDGYFDMPTFDNITPIGHVDSLIGVLKGIDDALASAGVDIPRGIYEITIAEAAADALDSSRASDQGDTVDVGSITDADFRDDVYVYWNGQLLYNDPTPAANKGAVQNDVARQTGTLSTLLFSGNLKRAAVIQIVNMS